MASLRSGGGLENVAFAVVEPAVVGAGDAALLDAPVDERRAAVRAVVGEQADATGLVLEEDEVLAEEADELRGVLVRELLRDGDGHPVPAEQVARGLAGADQRHEVVRLLGFHRWSSASRVRLSVSPVRERAPSPRIYAPPGAIAKGRHP